MTVHFIGAGPGAADLITVRGHRLIRACPVVLYAGSLVPPELVAEAGAEAARPPRVVDTAPLDLEAIIRLIRQAHAEGLEVARVHSGDPSLYGAIGEQIRRLDALGIAWSVVPGVPAFAAAAAALGRELTLPEVSQTVILTRTAVRASKMPPGEDLVRLAESRATLALHLSVGNIERVVADLTPAYGADCPVAVVYRASWPEETVLKGTLADIAGAVRETGLKRSALILVGRVLDPPDFPDSHLYDAGHARHLRRRED